MTARLPALLLALSLAACAGAAPPPAAGPPAKTAIAPGALVGSWSDGSEVAYRFTADGRVLRTVTTQTTYMDCPAGCIEIRGGSYEVAGTFHLAGTDLILDLATQRDLVVGGLKVTEPLPRREVIRIERLEAGRTLLLRDARGELRVWTKLG